MICYGDSMFLLPRENIGESDFDRKYLIHVTGVVETYSWEVVDECLAILKAKAEEQGGLDSVQTFVDPDGEPPIKFECSEGAVSVWLDQ